MPIKNRIRPSSPGMSTYVPAMSSPTHYLSTVCYFVKTRRDSCQITKPSHQVLPLQSAGVGNHGVWTALRRDHEGLPSQNNPSDNLSLTRDVVMIMSQEQSQAKPVTYYLNRSLRRGEGLMTRWLRTNSPLRGSSLAALRAGLGEFSSSCEAGMSCCRRLTQ